jgi:hypothetical protein
MPADLANRRRVLEPVRSGSPWLAWGVAIQAVGVAPVAAIMWRNIRKQSLGGHVTAEMIKFAWHSELHTRAGLIVLVAGSVIYAAGSVVMARPYISSPAALFVAVPLAAVAGFLVLGVIVLVIAVAFVLIQADIGIDLPGPDRRRRKSRRDLL